MAEPDALTYTLTAVKATCGASDGSATVFMSGGTPAYTFSWSGGGTGSTKTGLAAGAYTVTVTDNNSCTEVITVTISNVGAPLIVLDSIRNIVCLDPEEGAIFISATGGNPPYTYSWTGGSS